MVSRCLRQGNARPPEGTFAEECASSYGFTREAQGRIRRRSTTPPSKPATNGSFAWEIAPVTVAAARRCRDRQDEGPFAVNVENIPTLKPAFKKDGTVTAANSSSISDGAAAMVLMRASQAAKLGLNPIARIVGHTTNAGVPALFPSAPVGAMQKLFAKTGGHAERSICTRSTKPSPSSPWPPCMPKLDPARSTSTAAPVRWATRSAPPVPHRRPPCSAP